MPFLRNFSVYNPNIKITSIGLEMKLAWTHDLQLCVCFMHFVQRKCNKMKQPKMLPDF